MAYVLYTPPTHTGPSFTPRGSRGQRALGRVWGPLNVGYTQFRIGGTWHQKSIPSTAESVAADTDDDGTVLFLRGGHWHWLLEDTYLELVAAGLTPGEVAPSASGTWPSVATFPSSTTYPGVA